MFEAGHMVSTYRHTDLPNLKKWDLMEIQTYQVIWEKGKLGVKIEGVELRQRKHNSVRISDGSVDIEIHQI